MFVPKQKRPNTVQPLGEISDPAKSQGLDGATPIRGAPASYEGCLVFFFDVALFACFFFPAMTVFLDVGDEVRQGWFKSRA